MPDRNIRSRLNAPGSKFPRELTAGWSKPSSKFVGEMVWGIPASQDGKRSEIARSRQEEIPRIQTADRLSRNRSAEGREERRAERLAERGSRGVERNTVLGLDRSEVRKEYAPKRESLDPGWEGSAGEVPAGDWLCSVTAAAVEGSEVPPLPQELVAARGEGFVSANAAIVAAVGQREGGRTHVQVSGNARPAVRPGRQEVEGEASCAASSNLSLGTAPTRIRFPMR